MVYNITMRHIFIMNPSAGNGMKIKNLKEQIIELYKNEHYVIEITKKKRHAQELARKYASSNEELIIYACGGDGTVNEVVNGIYGFKNVRMVVIPIGTGNDFIKSLPFSKEALIDLNNYVDYKEMDVDLLKVNNEFLGINTVSAGLDVIIASNVDKFKQLPFKDSTFPYYLSLIYSMVGKITTPLTLFIDDKAIKYQDYTFVVASNGSYYGGGYRPSPEAKFDDGKIEICLIKKVPRSMIAVLQDKYKKGTHTKYKRIVESYSCKKLQIMSDDVVKLNIDGEVMSFKNPVIEIIPKAIKVCIPSKVNE